MDTTIESVIRSERFSHIPNVRRSPELINNNSVTFSHRTTVVEVVARRANFEDSQQSEPMVSVSLSFNACKKFSVNPEKPFIYIGMYA